MAKIIKYRIASTIVSQQFDEIGDTLVEAKPEIVLSDVSISYNSDNETIAKNEAYNGEYTIEDVSDIEEVNPQADTDAMLVDHEYRLTLLELGLTE